MALNLANPALLNPLARLLDVFGQTSNIDSLCDPEIEDCDEDAESHIYEEYTEVNRSLGLIMTVFTISPLFFYSFSVFPWNDDAAAYSLKTNQPIYWYTWIFFASSHVVIFGPFAIIWSLINNQDPQENLVAFYTYWLREVIKSFGYVVMALNDLAFITSIFLYRDSEDEYFSLIIPIITVLFYTFAASGVAFIVSLESDGAILYYDPDKRQDYEDYKDEQAASDDITAPALRALYGSDVPVTI